MALSLLLQRRQPLLGVAAHLLPFLWRARRIAWGEPGHLGGWVRVGIYFAARMIWLREETPIFLMILLMWSLTV
jgi:hypothetical protein